MIKVCERCGKEFETNRSYQKFCSHDCQIKAYAKRYLEHKRELRRKCRRDKKIAVKIEKPKPILDPAFKDNIPVRRLNGEILCMWCGHEFDGKHNQRFCCDEHATLFYDQLFNR